MNSKTRMVWAALLSCGAALGCTTESPDGFVDQAASVQATGEISLTELSIQGHPELGQGPIVSIDFSDPTAVVPLLDGRTRSADGCVAYGFPAGSGASLDEGGIKLTVADGTPEMPPCLVLDDGQYQCVTARHPSQVGDMFPLTGQPDLFAMSDPTGRFTQADIGRWLEISGADAPGNNGLFPIVSLLNGGTSPVFVNPAGQDEPSSQATYFVRAGAGPIPDVADPGFLEDDDIVTVELQPGATRTSSLSPRPSPWGTTSSSIRKWPRPSSASPSTGPEAT